MNPRPTRPHMPGYGVLPAEEGTGLLSWTDAERRLTHSHDYWLATTWSDGRPHVMPVWGVWDGSGLWFSSGGRSRKIANLARDPRCVVTTDDALNPVILEAVAEVVVDADRIRGFLDLLNAKYATDYGLDFLDPSINATVRTTPRAAFALLQGDFTGSPTRWTFDDPPATAGP
jgi:PPOX class probable F420-dependent enzyme